MYQRMSGCEWDNETGTIDTYEQHGYNGEDFLSLNIHQMRWIAAVPEALPSKYERDGNRGELISIKSFLTQECTDRLKKYVASNVLQPTGTQMVPFYVPLPIASSVCQS